MNSFERPARFWHASGNALPVGTRLSPRPGYAETWQSDGAGLILETYRPAGALGHGDAVFMCDDPQDCDNCGARCDWLFQVEPEGTIERHDLAWASEIDCLISDGLTPQDPAVAELARRYWDGEASDLPVWEYLSTAAIILTAERY